MKSDDPSVFLDFDVLESEAVEAIHYLYKFMSCRKSNDTGIEVFGIKLVIRPKRPRPSIWPTVYLSDKDPK